MSKSLSRRMSHVAALALGTLWLAGCGSTSPLSLDDSQRIPVEALLIDDGGGSDGGSTGGGSTGGGGTGGGSTGGGGATAGAKSCAPGFWKTHPTLWPAPYTWNTPFSSVFANAFPGKTLGQVLSSGGGGMEAFARHAISALLSAKSGAHVLAPSQVVAMFNSAYAARKTNGNPFGGCGRGKK